MKTFLRNFAVLFSALFSAWDSAMVFLSNIWGKIDAWSGWAVLEKWWIWLKASHRRDWR
jgi:hypothetical protein